MTRVAYQPSEKYLKFARDLANQLNTLTDEELDALHFRLNDFDKADSLILKELIGDKTKVLDEYVGSFVLDLASFVLLTEVEKRNKEAMEADDG